MIPSRKLNMSICIGSSTGLNQIGVTRPGIFGGAVWKKVLEITVTASPKKDPNNRPQIVVETPHQKNIFILRFSPGSMPLNFNRHTAQAIAMTRP